MNIKGILKSFVILLMVTFLFTCKNFQTEEKAHEDAIAQFDVTYDKTFGNVIYPSLIFGLNDVLMQQNEQEKSEYFTLVVNPKEKTDIKIIIQESTLNEETVIRKKGVKGKTEIPLSIKWKYERLKKLNQSGYVNMTFIYCAEADEKEIDRKDLKLKYASINECVLAARDVDTKQDIPLYFLIASFINEESPVVDEFLGNVSRFYGTQFVGYQMGEDEVDNQVKAIYNTLQRMGVKYSNITTTSNTEMNKNVVSQHIRFCDEVLKNTQANCADGTAFFCSVLRKIGIHTQMVFVPGHVYLAYFTDERNNNVRLLETTVIGSGMSFEDATNHNVDDYNSDIRKFNNEDFFDGYFIIDVDEARKYIKPIGR